MEGKEKREISVELSELKSPMMGLKTVTVERMQVAAIKPAC